MNPLADILARLRARIRACELVHAGARLATVLIAGVVVWILLDQALVRADLSCRPFLSAALLPLLGIGMRGLLAAIRSRHDADALALRLEQAYPVLDGRLASAVQFSRDPGTASPALVAALGKEVAALLPALDHRSAWDARPARRMATLAVMALSVALSLAAWRPAVAVAGLRRLAFQPAAYPTSTRIVAVTVPALVGQGDAVPILVTVDGDIPEQAEARLRAVDGSTATLGLRREGEVFRGTVEQALGDLTLVVCAGDGRSEPVQVHVAPRPALEGISLQLTFPPHLDRVPETTALGDLRVPVGTRVAVHARFDRALEHAGLTLRCGGETRSELSLTEDRRSGDGRFTVTADGIWSLSLIGRDGLVGVTSRSTITAEPDRAPVISVVSPARDLEVTRFACWPVAFTARDDHALARIRLRWQVLAQDGAARAPGSLDVALPGSDGAGATVLDLAALGLEPGARLEWWLEADDRAANTGRSRHFTCTIRDPRELRERMARERAGLGDMIDAVRDRQHEAGSQLDAVRGASER